MKFSYTIINKEGKKLTGTIDADSETEARDELNRLGFPVIDITEIAAETAEEILGKTTKYEFEAIDQNSRRVIGTISGEDRYETFRRLVNEYHFTVETLWRAAASLEEKEQEKNLGVVELYTKLKKESSAIEKPTQVMALEKEQQEKENFIVQHVDMALEKVKNLFEEYGGSLKDEERLIIKEKSDRLIRLKTSSNVEYVRHLAEELLIYLENQEGYLRENMGENEELKKFNLEVKKLLSELKEERLRPTIRQSILQAIQKWKEKNITDEETLGLWMRSLNQIYSFIEDILTEPPEISSRKEKKRLLSKQIFSYYKLFIREKSPQLREEIKESIRRLRQEKAAISQEIKDIQEKYREEERLREDETAFQKLTKEMLNLLGWILFFYLFYYFLSLYVDSPFLKKFENFFQPNITKPFLILLTLIFIIYITGKTKKMFFPKTRFSGIIASVVVISSSTLILLNF